MEDAKQQAETSLSKFSNALNQVEQTLRPVLKSLDELRASGNEEDLDSMSRARMHISLAYAVNTLFCMYLRTQGVDPATHPVSDEIGRVQEAFMRMRKVESGLSVDHQRAPDRDRRRYYENVRRNSQKLAGLIFPEEVDLLNAIRGKKRKREAEQNEKEKKMRKKGKECEPQSGGESDSSDDDGNGNHTKGNAANPEHAMDSSEEESERKKTKKRDERNAEKTSARKKRKKSKNDESADINSDKKRAKGKSGEKSKSDEKSKKDKKSKKFKEKDDVSDQQSKGSTRSDQKRKMKKKTK